MAPFQFAAAGLLLVVTALTANALPFRRVDPATEYTDLSNHQCLAANHATQAGLAPNWDYSAPPRPRWDVVGGSRPAVGATTTSKLPLGSQFEPVLESVKGCNGLSGDQEGMLKQFQFLTVLDGSWVAHYHKNRAHFATQGYPTLESSPNLLMDHASYIFEAQFGIRVKARAVVALPGLESACDFNTGGKDAGGKDVFATQADYHGKPSSDTFAALKGQGTEPQPGVDAGTLRLGAYNPDAGRNYYCHSSSPVGDLCRADALIHNQKPAFIADTGLVNQAAINTLVHEFGHFFGVCPSSGPSKNPHCTRAHSLDAVGDLMSIAGGPPAGAARPAGFPRRSFAKFMTACTPLYRDTVCAQAQAATCGVAVAPASIAGEFVETSFGAAANDWHFVTVTSTTPATQRVYQWANRAGVAWTLTRDRDDRGLFHVGASCPYYAQGYTTARATFDTRTGAVAALQGPGNGVYLLRGTVPAHDPALCPHGSTSATCWGNSAYQMCPHDRQGAYAKVMARRGSQAAMHAVFAKLAATGLGCTKALPADRHAACPQWNGHCAKSSPWHLWMASNCATTCWNAL